MAEDNNQDPQGQSSTTPDPSGQDGESTKTTEPNKQPDSDVDNLPEKFKGKSAGDIAKSYLELEKKLGDQSRSVSEAQKQLSQWEKLGKVLESNPELYKQVEAEIGRLSGKKSDTTENDQAPKINDLEVTQRNSIISEFEKDYGIKNLSTEKRNDLNQKIVTELAEMLDPGGTKEVKEIIGGIPLPRLRTYFEKAYKLATAGDREEQVRLHTLLETRQNNEASFGSIPSSSLETRKGQLTDEEKKVAKQMGISEEAYLKQKNSLNE